MNLWKPNFINIISKTLPLKSRLYSVYFLFFIFLFIIIIFTYAISEKSIKEFNKFEENANHTQTDINIIHKIMKIEILSARYINDGHESSIKEFENLYTIIKNNLISSIDINHLGLKKDFKDILKHLEAYYKSFNKVIIQHKAQKNLINVKFRNIANEIHDVSSYYIENNTYKNEEKVLLLEIKNSLLSIENDAFKYFENLDSTHIQRTKEHFKLTKRKIEIFNHLQTKKSKRLLNILNHVLSFESVFLEAVQRTRGYLYLVNVVMSADSYEMLYHLNKISSIYEQNIAEAEKKLILNLSDFPKILLVLGLFFLIILFGITYIIGLSITKPINKLTNEFNKLSQGSKDEIQIISYHNDEIGELITSAKVFRDKNEMFLNQHKLASMGEMIRNVSHQWRQPLANLNGVFLNLELDFDNKSLNKEVFNDYLLQMEDITAYLSRTINDFTNFFKIEKEKEEFDIKEIVLKSYSMTYSSLKSNNIEIILDVENSCIITSYPSELMQVIFTIINNAQDAFSHKEIENKNIYIGLYQNEKNICLEFRDNAGGIDDEIISKLFDPYFTTKHKSQGTGLGLFIAKTIVEKSLNGKIFAKNIENGAIFTIEL